MKHTVQVIEQTLTDIPPARRTTKLWRTLQGIGWIAGGVGIWRFGIGPGWLHVVVIAIGGTMISGDLLRFVAAIFRASAKDVAEGIKDIRGSLS